MMTIAERVRFVAAAALICSVASVGAASAQSLKELRAREAAENALNREVGYTQTVCANSISASIDWRSAADWPEDVSIVSSCDGALGALEAVCRTDAGKRRAKRVTRFVCAASGDGASLKGGVLRYGASPGGNGFASTKAILDSEL